MAAFEPIRFGKYQLIERIATGGMAEVYKAKSYGVAGFEKLLVIKRYPSCDWKRRRVQFQPHGNLPLSVVMLRKARRVRKRTHVRKRPTKALELLYDGFLPPPTTPG